MTSETTHLTLDGHRLAAVCLNPGAPGEPVILLHGTTSSTSFWQVNPAPYLLEPGPCYALSLPGHFPALAPDEFKSGMLTAERLVSLLESGICQLAGERPVTQCPQAFSTARSIFRACLFSTVSSPTRSKPSNPTSATGIKSAPGQILS